MGLNRMTDRCDKCRAEAFVRMVKDDMELDFCIHHHRYFEGAFNKAGWTIAIDERDKVNVKPSVSANAD